MERLRLRADLILELKKFKGEIDLRLSDFFLSSLGAERAHLQKTAKRATPSSMRVVNYQNILSVPIVVATLEATLRSSLTITSEKYFSKSQ